MLEKLKEHDREKVINSPPLPVVQNLADPNMHAKKNLLEQKKNIMQLISN